MEKMIEVVNWWQYHIYTLGIIDTMGDLYSEILIVVSAFFIYPIPWAIILTWITNRKISKFLKISIIVVISAFVLYGDNYIAVYVPIILFTMFFIRKRKISNVTFVISLLIIALTQIKIPIDYYLYKMRCNHEKGYPIELLDKKLTLKDLERPISPSISGHFVLDSILYTKLDRTSLLPYGADYYNLYLKKDNRIIARQIVPFRTLNWMERLDNGFKSGKFPDRREECIIRDDEQKIVERLRDLVRKSQK